MTKIVIFDSWVLFLASFTVGLRIKFSAHFTEEYNLRGYNPKIVDQRRDSVDPRLQAHMRCVIRCLTMLFKKSRKLNLVARTIGIYYYRQSRGTSQDHDIRTPQKKLRWV